jgi:hypothetical protein
MYVPPRTSQQKQTSSGKSCTKIHSIECTVKSRRFLEEEDIIRFTFKTTEGSKWRLWFLCRSMKKFNSICFDLDQTIYWKVTYECNTKKIIRMEQLSWACSIQ